MKERYFTIDGIPALLLGDEADGVWLFVHGKSGSKEEARDFAALACTAGCQVLGIDLPCHGARSDEADGFDPWHAVPELMAVMAYAQAHWQHICLRANSIGAWFSLLAFAACPPEHSLLVSPLLDMERLITRMMEWAGVLERQLEHEGTIVTSFGETLSWEYLQYARAHRITAWASPTDILYAGRDDLIERATVEGFCRRFSCRLAVMEDGEHWFHTPAQLAVLGQWTNEHLADSR